MGGSVVILIEDCKMDIGKSGCGLELNQSLEKFTLFDKFVSLIKILLSFTKTYDIFYNFQFIVIQFISLLLRRCGNKNYKNEIKHMYLIKNSMVYGM